MTRIQSDQISLKIGRTYEAFNRDANVRDARLLLDLLVLAHTLTVQLAGAVRAHVLHAHVDPLLDHTVPEAMIMIY